MGRSPAFLGLSAKTDHDSQSITQSSPHSASSAILPHTTRIADLAARGFNGTPCKPKQHLLIPACEPECAADSMRSHISSIRQSTRPKSHCRNLSDQLRNAFFSPVVQQRNTEHEYRRLAEGSVSVETSSVAEEDRYCGSNRSF